MLKKYWIGIFTAAALLVGAITVGVVAAQDTGEGENTAEAENSAPKTILGRVAAVLGLDEATVEDAFQQARKDQKTEAYRDKLDRQVENGRITSEEAEEQFIWFQSRPDSVAGSFREKGRQRPGFGHVQSFEGKRFGMRMHRRGGRWAGPDFSSSGWHNHDGQKSLQQEVAPIEPSSETDPASQ